MASLVLTGDTSGQVTVAAPAVAGTNTLTLQAATATSAVNTLDTAKAYNWNGLTTNTSLDFTGLPAWIKRITVMFTGVSTSSTSNLIVQLGSSSFTTSGYTGYVARFGSSTAYLAYSSGFLLSETVQAASTIVGHLTITNITSNTWVGSGISTSASAINFTSSTAGSVALGGTLDRIRITTVGSPATDTFDAGSVNILYEG